MSGHEESFTNAQQSIINFLTFVCPIIVITIFLACFLRYLLKFWSRRKRQQNNLIHNQTQITTASNLQTNGVISMCLNSHSVHDIEAGLDVRSRSIDGANRQQLLAMLMLRNSRFPGIEHSFYSHLHPHAIPAFLNVESLFLEGTILEEPFPPKYEDALKMPAAAITPMRAQHEHRPITSTSSTTQAQILPPPFYESYNNGSHNEVSNMQCCKCDQTTGLIERPPAYSSTVNTLTIMPETGNARKVSSTCSTNSLNARLSNSINSTSLSPTVVLENSNKNLESQESVNFKNFGTLSNKFVRKSISQHGICNARNFSNNIKVFPKQRRYSLSNITENSQVSNSSKLIKPVLVVVKNEIESQKINAKSLQLDGKNDVIFRNHEKNEKERPSSSFSLRSTKIQPYNKNNNLNSKRQQTEISYIASSFPSSSTSTSLSLNNQRELDKQPTVTDMLADCVATAATTAQFTALVFPKVSKEESKRKEMNFNIGKRATSLPCTSTSELNHCSASQNEYRSNDVKQKVSTTCEAIRLPQSSTKSLPRRVSSSKTVTSPNRFMTASLSTFLPKKNERSYGQCNNNIDEGEKNQENQTKSL